MSKIDEVRLGFETAYIDGSVVSMLWSSFFVTL